MGWKTGTSFGYRDGWAVGVTPEYVIGVWVGNASGEGRPGLVGISTAGPILFDLFNLVGETSWFREPVFDMKKVEICKLSGHRAGPHCDTTETRYIPQSGLETEACPYHRTVHLNREMTRRVSSRCADLSEMQKQSWFLLPPAQEWYYRQSHSSYRELPSYIDGCNPGGASDRVMELIYPINTARIYLPKELDGTTGSTVFEVAHRSSATAVHWHLDDRYLGTTRETHQMALTPDPGWHTLSLVDEEGSTLRHRFQILSR